MKSSIELKKFSRQMKHHLTPSESYVLKQIETLNIPVKNQMILGFYIMDFILPTKMINIEIDGGVHLNKIRYDFLRDNFTRASGFFVIRINNDDIYSYDYEKFLSLPDYSEEVFRSALGKANQLKSKYIQKSRTKVPTMPELL